MNIVHRTEQANSVDLIIFWYYIVLNWSCPTENYWLIETTSFEFFCASSFSTPLAANVKPIKTFYNAKLGKYFVSGITETQKPSVLCTGELCQFWCILSLVCHHLRKLKPFYSFISDFWLSENRILVYDKCYRAINCFMSLVVWIFMLQSLRNFA